ncbi:MAG: GC-type dockerin domain-anchored protein, partial [Actinomycetota bacterium]|nr:GC-type dockerin domain-anchored protein [Actinomycetota bacterium]
SCHDFDLTFADGSTRSTGEVCVACGAVPDCPGDATGDAVVDGQDLAAVLAAWGADVPDVDQNADGTIDGQDLAAVLAAWGLPCGQ